jgi:hypothetical protein
MHYNASKRFPNKASEAFHHVMNELPGITLVKMRTVESILSPPLPIRKESELYAHMAINASLKESGATI